MPTITLHAGAVTDYGGTFGTGGGLTGSGALWDDASDSTYLESKGVNSATPIAQGSAPLDPLVLPPGATVTSVTFNCRVQQTTGAYQTHIGILVQPSSHTGDSFGPTDPTGDFQGITIPSSGSILNLATAATDFASWGVGDLAGLVTLFGASDTIISARNVPNRLSGAIVPSQIRVYELSVDVTYADPIELPCNTWVDLDLSTATYLIGGGGTPGPYGQYEDGVIWTIPGSTGPGLDGFPDFYFLGLALEAVKGYRVEVTYDPASIHDNGGRTTWLTGLEGGNEPETYLNGPFQFGGLFDASTNSADVLSARIGSTSVGSEAANYWDDPDVGVAAGFNNIWFTTDHAGAVSSIRIRKLCATFAPPLQQYPRHDGLAASSVRLHWPDPNSIQRGIQRGPSATQ